MFFSYKKVIMFIRFSKSVSEIDSFSVRNCEVSFSFLKLTKEYEPAGRVVAEDPKFATCSVEWLPCPQSSLGAAPSNSHSVLSAETLNDRQLHTESVHSLKGIVYMLQTVDG